MLLSDKSSQVELYCHSATCGDIQWNEMSCLTGPRCYINTDRFIKGNEGGILKFQ